MLLRKYDLDTGELEKLTMIQYFITNRIGFVSAYRLSVHSIRQVKFKNTISIEINEADYLISPSYMGFYYLFIKTEGNMPDVWVLYDNDIDGRFFTFNADNYRIDQCFDYVFKYLLVNKKYDNDKNSNAADF